MKIRYVGRRPRDVAPATGARPFPVEPGQVVEVDDKTGKSLLDQPVWFQPVAEQKESPKKATETKENG